MADRTAGWRNLPAELCALPQWCVAGASKAPLALNAAGTLFAASVTRPSEWMTFEQAARYAWENQNYVTQHVQSDGTVIQQVGLDIGYILHQADPFTCIDLDVKDAESHPNKPNVWTSPDQWDRYGSIVEQFDTYTERSRSGKGFHVWVKGKVGRGFRRDGVEVYSQERFIISTGNVLRNRPIRDNKLLLANLVSRMMPAPEEFAMQEVPAEEDDWAILDTAFNASNGEKFLALWQGKWQELGFPSQSEADLALMSMLTFYSPSNEQCRRMFRDSALGKRDKAIRDDRYVNLTLTTIRERESREQRADISIMMKTAEAIAESHRTNQQRAAAEIARLTGMAVTPQQFSGQQSRAVPALHAPTGAAAPPLAPTPESVAMAALAPLTAQVLKAGEEGIPWPPGFAGHIARYIFQSAYLPVKEVAIVSTLGLLAGVAGKAWHIPKSGLNLYVILVARSAIGKETLHGGISEIVKACKREYPLFEKYVDFVDYSSGPALIKACVANPCFVNVAGEWGRKLKRLAAEDGRDGPLQTLRTQMTNLYQKSGPQSIVGGIGYSAVDNNVASVAGVSYSMIGETTPGTFYESLTPSMMEDGFLSRFLVIEYEGDRVEPNKKSLSEPDEYLRKVMIAIAQQADTYASSQHSHLVDSSAEAAAMIEAFEYECAQNIRGTKDESRRQMWNRAALKSLRVAGLLAVADNYLTPQITVEHITWAQALVRADIAVMSKRLTSGDVGLDDQSRERKLAVLIRDYLSNPVPASYKVPEAMQKAGIVPRSYLQIRIQRVASFYNHKLGVNRALDDTLNSMVASGYLMETERSKTAEAFNFHGKAFRVLSLPNYDAEDAQ